MIKYIYLDTSYLQKWQSKNLLPEEIRFLDHLKDNDEYKFVLSFTHISEIMSRDDKDKALKLAVFLDELPKVWMRSSSYLTDMEIKQAHQSFRGFPPMNLSPFTDHFKDFFESSPSLSGDPRILEDRLTANNMKIIDLVEGAHSQFKIYDSNYLNSNYINGWVDSNHKILHECSKTKEKLKKITLERNLEKAIKQLSPSLNKAIVKDFIIFLLGNLELIPSFLFLNYVLFNALNNKTKKWKESHIGDLVHMEALPYVDILTVDKDAYEQYLQTKKYIEKKFVKINYMCRVYKNIKSLIDSFSHEL